MKKLIVLFALMSVTLSCAQTTGWTEDETKKIKKGNKIVKKIEKYRARKGTLPDRLNDIGIKEDLSGPYFYERVHSNNFMLWFGTSLGEGVYYYSDNKKWDYRLRGMKKNE